MPESPDAALARRLLLPATIRQRAHRMLDLGIAGELLHFRVDSGKLVRTADFVLETIQRNYPTLDVPFHARWRHFAAGGFDRWATLDRGTAWASHAARARAAFDLAILSVLLDAGAGPDWRYREADTGEILARSEGLAVASFDLFRSGAFSQHPGERLRADGAALSTVTAQTIADGFQAGPGNAMVGLEGRAALVRRLGETVAARPDVFGRADDPRPGGLFDYLAAQSEGGILPAQAILAALLEHLGPIWPSRLSLAGVGLGDTWRHPLITTDDATSTYVPLHKLSQWLAYSLIEPLQWAGIGVSGIDALTGLAEYRNGGLFVDMGLISLKDPADASVAHEVGSTLVVEWRALTVALLDDVGAVVRNTLGLGAEEMPLAKVLEGGTWAAGRRIARMRRPGGAPPLRVISDGTVF
jgi:hypothetical protein